MWGTRGGARSRTAAPVLALRLKLNIRLLIHEHGIGIYYALYYIILSNIY
jgi:hypothetical protein